MYLEYGVVRLPQRRHEIHEAILKTVSSIDSFKSLGAMNRSVCMLCMKKTAVEVNASYEDNECNLFVLS